MTLSKEDGHLYYELWFPLLNYVNEKYGINPKLKKMANAKKLNPNDVKEIADKLWDDVSIIDEYLELYSGYLPEGHKDIIRSWKRRIRGRFILERHLKKGSIVMSMDDEQIQVFMVSGIMSSWKEMFPNMPLPIVFEATIMPFKEVIISDGLVIPYNINIGYNMKIELKDIYLTAKKNGLLRKNL